MKKVNCQCGRLLGYIEGKYDLRCPKCKTVSVGDTADGKVKLTVAMRDEAPEVRRTKIPRNMMPVR